MEEFICYVVCTFIHFVSARAYCFALMYFRYFRCLHYTNCPSTQSFDLNAVKPISIKLSCTRNCPVMRTEFLYGGTNTLKYYRYSFMNRMGLKPRIPLFEWYRRYTPYKHDCRGRRLDVRYDNIKE
jgi:hypothetical protein